MLDSVEEQRDSSSPLRADSPSSSPVFLPSPQHHSSSSSASSISSSGSSDIVRGPSIYLNFNWINRSAVTLCQSVDCLVDRTVNSVSSLCQESDSPLNSSAAAPLHHLTLPSLHSVMHMATDLRTSHPAGLIHSTPQVCSRSLFADRNLRSAPFWLFSKVQYFTPYHI